jgi:hypothetical protein
MTILLVIAAFIAGVGLAGAAFWEMRQRDAELSRVRERLAVIEEQARQAEQDRARIEAEAGLRAKSHYSYNTIEALEDATSNIVRAIIEAETNKARLETALSQIGAVRNKNGHKEKSQ